MAIFLINIGGHLNNLGHYQSEESLSSSIKVIQVALIMLTIKFRMCNKF